MEVEVLPDFSQLAPGEMIKTQALIVTAGPFAGRICENDDDDTLFRSDADDFELSWMEEAGVEWRRLETEAIEEAAAEGFTISDDDLVVDCEIVTFGFYLECPGYFLVPRQFLRPATMKDLVQRYSEIRDLNFHAARVPGRKKIPHKRLNEFLIEQAYITNEIWRRESLAKEPSQRRTAFLCHASADKPFVRQVRNDLANAGHSVWIDEFEIAVGDSIVDKISEATAQADALILFMSKESTESGWVRREWQSALARSLSGAGIRVLPALIEDCELPAILADVKYADFRNSYQFGLKELLAGLDRPTNAEKKN